MKKAFLTIIVLLCALLQTACSSDSEKSDGGTVTPPVVTSDFIKAADISFLPEIEAAGVVFTNNGKTEDMLTTLKSAGCNTIRIRLWKDPANGHSGLT
ncbi:MAG: arabinogalactan endo-1,4-beta-galactosidase, partial [Flavobacterium sp.]